MMGRTILVRDCLRSDLFSASGHRSLGKNGIKRDQPQILSAEFILRPRSVNDQPRYFKFLHGSTTHVIGEP